MKNYVCHFTKPAAFVLISQNILALSQVRNRITHAQSVKRPLLDSNSDMQLLSHQWRAQKHHTTFECLVKGVDRDRTALVADDVIEFVENISRLEITSEITTSS